MTPNLEKSDAAAIQRNLDVVRERIAAAAEKAGRNASEVTLVAVTKSFDPEHIRVALDMGQRVFGENRVQEAQAKYPDLKLEFSDLRLHLIGPLQTNKAKDAVALFDVIETLDRPKLARHLAKAMEKLDRRPVCYVQVNTGEELQKAGISPQEADDFIAYCRNEAALSVEGLMCVPPLDEPPAPHFALLGEIARRNALGILSMGMSADFETAIELGATHVRVGSAIFGKRTLPIS